MLLNWKSETRPFKLEALAEKVGVADGIEQIIHIQEMEVAHAPGLRAQRAAVALPQEELLEAVARPAEILVGGLSRAHEIAQRLVSLVGDRDRRELPAAQQAGELEGIPAVGLDAIAGTHRHQRGRHHGAVDPHRRQLSIEDVATGEENPDCGGG